jgi:aspartate oxidase
MVFGPRVVEAIERGVDGPAATGAMRSVLGGGDIGGVHLEVPPAEPGVPVDRDVLQRTMTADAGVLRSAASLEVAAAACRGEAAGDGPAAWELRNLATVGRALCAAALAREESRGAHARSDHPETRAELRRRFVTSTP